MNRHIPFTERESGIVPRGRPFIKMHGLRNDFIVVDGRTQTYNPSAEEICSLVLEGFPEADITFGPDLKRQTIVDSWPADVDDSAARKDWGWQPDYDVDRAFDEYLVPAIREYYINQS